jgi:hypothetical protein
LHWPPHWELTRRTPATRRSNLYPGIAKKRKEPWHVCAFLFTVRNFDFRQNAQVKTGASGKPGAGSGISGRGGSGLRRSGSGGLCGGSSGLGGCGAGCSALGLLRNEMPACAVPAKLDAIATKVSDILASSTEILGIVAPSAPVFLRSRGPLCAKFYGPEISRKP